MHLHLMARDDDPVVTPPPALEIFFFKYLHFFDKFTPMNRNIWRSLHNSYLKLDTYRKLIKLGTTR